MKRLATIVFFTLTVTAAMAQFTESDHYYERTDLLLAPASALSFGLYGYANPAILSAVEFGDVLFAWDAAPFNNDESGIGEWGLFFGAPMFGFSVRQFDTQAGERFDYKVSVATPPGLVSSGYSWRYTSDDEHYFGMGLLYRPNRLLSISAHGEIDAEFEDYELIGEAAIRPALGREWVTLFADVVYDDVEDLKWSAGAALEPVRGVRITGRGFLNDQLEFENFTVGAVLSLGELGFSAQGTLSEDFAQQSMQYAVRAGAVDRSIIRESLLKNSRYVEINLMGATAYRSTFFGQERTLFAVLRTIDEAAKDESVAGLVINASSMVLSSAMTWEIREALSDFRSTGKHVVVYLDFAGMNGYHLASVADRIVIDPQGMVSLPGVVVPRVYLNETLNRLGIGVEEIRVDDYKSGFETFTRTNMSDADREQLLALAESDYELMRNEISESRSVEADVFDEWVNGSVVMSATKAEENGLVDIIGRAKAVREAIRELEGTPKFITSPFTIAGFRDSSDDRWGERPKIALIYALGSTSMDTGMQARTLSRLIRGQANSPFTQAIVIRVDSGGGAAIAADVVAEAVDYARTRKPVVITMGDVAASGGYWLALSSSAIFASPNTVTGSIGAIAGSFYDNGLVDSVGITSDFVKVGEYADLAFGIFGVLRNRPMNDTEREDMDEWLREIYDQFVNKVSEERDLTEDSVREIAGGRIWSGTDAKERGLVDELGGIRDAVMHARTLANISKDAEIDIIEYHPVDFDMDGLGIGAASGLEKETKAFLESVQYRVEYSGKPLLILPLDFEMLKNRNQ